MGKRMATIEAGNGASGHPVVSYEQWVAARKDLLRKEKALTRMRDELAAERRALPWVRVDKSYVFNTTGGHRSLADLFDGRSQLVVYHFMLGPGWGEGCKSCSYLADHFDGPRVHLAARDVSFTAVSRAPLAEIAAFKQRMGWQFPWASSYGGDFNYDFQVSFSKDDLAKGKVYYNYDVGSFPSEEAPGVSVFHKDAAGRVFHTYSAYARGLDALVGAYQFLDLVPRGRDEDGLGFTMEWVRHHDRYDDATVGGGSSSCGCAPAGVAS